MLIKLLNRYFLGGRIAFQGKEIDLPNIKFKQLALLVYIYHYTHWHPVRVDVVRFGYNCTKTARFIRTEPQASHATIEHIFNHCNVELPHKGCAILICLEH